MRYGTGRPPYFRSQTRGIGRVKVFCIGILVGAVLVFIGMTAWQSHQPVEIIVKSQDAVAAAPAALANDAEYIWSEGGFVGIKNPKENDKVSTSVTIDGMANAIDGEVTARVTELVRGKVVTVGEATATVKTAVPGTHGTFSVTVGIKPTRNQGTLEVSVARKKDGKESDTVIIPLQFVAEKKPATTTPETTPKPAATAPAATTP